MADSFRHVGPDRLQIREGGGCLAIFGLPFFAAGLFVCLAAVGVIPMSNASDLPASGWPALLLLGLAFTVVGGVLVFGRAWTTIDATRRFIVKEWGLLVPMYERPSTVNGYTSLTIAHEPGDSDTSEQFPILLRAGDRPGLRLCSFREYGTAQACAAAVAGLLLLDVEDVSTDHARRTPASQAGLPLQDRARLEQRHDEIVSAPVFARSIVSHENGTTRIVIPMPPVHPLVFGFTLLPVVLTLVVVPPLFRFFRQTNTPDPIGWWFLGMLILGLCVLPGSSVLKAWLRSRFGRMIVSVSTDGVRIETRGIWRTRLQKEIAASDILDVDYSTRESTIESARRATELRVLDAGRSRSGSADIGRRTERLIAFVSSFAKGSGITLKTRQGLTTFGEGLGDEETHYLHGIVRRALVGG